jgi:hypothetical protein
MENNYNDKANFLIEKFDDYQKKSNINEIKDQKVKLSYYSLFFDLYPELFNQNFNFTYLDEIKVLINKEINTFMVYFSEKGIIKKIIFDTPHYSIINHNFPINNWELLKIR